MLTVGYTFISQVSIQLVSPTSGESIAGWDREVGNIGWVSIQLVSPTSGEIPALGLVRTC